MSSDSEGEERIFSGFYGKALEPYDEETIQKKRAIPIEDQVAKDAQGRRRFHGAFTGGFSAGFFNTVGSLEGWKPSEFKSSRSSKAENTRQQRPQDYMDDEDMGEFGIAPQTVKATDDYNTSRKRKREVMSDGPIPGQPVLQTLIDSGNETIGYLLLRHMGYKHRNEDEEDVEDVEAVEENGDSQRVYGCEMPKSYRKPSKVSSQYSQDNIPEIYKNALSNPKSNSFGMGYKGLDRSHVNLFTSSKLVINDKNKKLSISGQAFGVGAFEDDDEDIYVKEDLSKYDFELTGEKKKTRALDTDRRKLMFDMFVQSVGELPMIERFPPPTIPASFTGKHKVRKSRFEPQILAATEVTPQRHEIDAATRAAILGDGTERQRVKPPTPPPPTPSSQETQVKEEPARRNMFDVLPNGLIFDKFVSAGKSESHAEILEPVQPSETTHGTRDMREAAAKKMFGPLTRVVVSWLPNALLCKRFNVPEPAFSDADTKSKHKRHRNLIFENASVADGGLETQIAGAPGLHVRSNAPPEMSATAVSAESAPLPAIQSAHSNSANATNVAISTDASPAPSVQANESKPALDPTEKLDISKNVDLYKAVFMDSDSDASDNDDDGAADKQGGAANGEEERRKREEEMKEKILAQDMLLLPQIKPIKPGILSHVEAIAFDRPNVLNIEEVKVEEGPKQASTAQISPEGTADLISTDNMYGPRLPTAITFRKPEKLQNLPKPTTSDQSSDSESDWVEKNDEGLSPKSKSKTERKHKHKKQKHKKDKKHKHKKHKSKR